MCVYKYVSTNYIGGGKELNQARIPKIMLEERPELARGLGTIFVPSGSRVEPSGGPGIGPPGSSWELGISGAYKPNVYMKT